MHPCSHRRVFWVDPVLVWSADQQSIVWHSLTPQGEEWPLSVEFWCVLLELAEVQGLSLNGWNVKTIHRGCTLCNVMFRTSGQSTSTQTKWQLQSPLSMLRKTCILYVSSDPSTWFQTLGRKCKLQIFVFFMKSCSTWEIILIDSKQLKVKKAQRSSVNPLFSHRCVICIYFLCDTYLVLSAELPLHLLASICQQCLSWV